MTTTNRPTGTLTHDNGWYTLTLSTGQIFCLDENEVEYQHEVEAWAANMIEATTW
jgi:hypothetical protein